MENSARTRFQLAYPYSFSHLDCNFKIIFFFRRLRKMELSTINTMNTYPHTIEEAKRRIDFYIQRELKKKSEISSLWIRSEFDRQKDFARLRGLDFSDAFIIDIVVEMGKKAVDIQLVDGERYQRNMTLSRPNDLVAGSISAEGNRITPAEVALGQQGGKGWIRSSEYHGKIGKGVSTHGNFGVVHNPGLNAPAVERAEYGKGLFDTNGGSWGFGDKPLEYFERVEGQNKKKELNMNRNNFNVDEFQTTDGALPFVWNGKREGATPFK